MKVISMQRFQCPLAFILLCLPVWGQAQESKGEDFLAKYLSDFTAASFSIQSELGISVGPAEPNAELRKEEMLKAQNLLLDDSLFVERTLDPFQDHRVSFGISQDLYFHIAYNQLESAEDLFSFALYSSGIHQERRWETYLVTKHFFISDLDSYIYFTIAEDKGQWKAVALGRAEEMVAAAAGTGLARVDSLPNRLRYPEKSSRMATLICKTPSVENEEGQLKWKGLLMEFRPQAIFDFITIELDPYEIEPAFLLDADFPLVRFRELARLKMEKHWDFTLLVPGPMDGILFRLPLRLVTARSTHAMKLSADGRAEVPWSILADSATAHDLYRVLVPVFEAAEQGTGDLPKDAPTD